MATWTWRTCALFSGPSRTIETGPNRGKTVRTDTGTRGTARLKKDSPYRANRGIGTVCGARRGGLRSLAPWLRRFVASPRFQPSHRNADGDPLRLLRQYGIKLRVCGPPLRLPGRVVWGEWDPLLRRITIHGAAERSDRELVESLLHELHHGSSNGQPSEAEIAAAASEHLAALSEADIATCAAFLRGRLDRSCHGTSNDDRNPVNPFPLACV